jgi:hypothetical protein
MRALLPAMRAHPDRSVESASLGAGREFVRLCELYHTLHAGKGHMLLTFELDPSLGADVVIYFANQFSSLRPVLMRSSRPARHGEKTHEI